METTQWTTVVIGALSLITNAVMIWAVLRAPKEAIKITKQIEAAEAKIRRRHWIFQTLMLTRGTGLSADHVNALNTIDIEFADNDPVSVDVRNAWKAYFDCLGEKDFTSDVNTKIRQEKLVKLLYAMSKGLGYEFNETTIKNDIYVPRGWGDREDLHWMIQKGWSEILTGTKPLAISTGVPIPDEARQSLIDAIEMQKELWQLTLNNIKNRVPMPVYMVDVVTKPDESK